MNPETFFDKFGLLADTPNGVQKLRELILQLAVQGKLVPQDPNDEPASVLLGKIKAEKERLVKEKKIRKPKKLPGISEDEKLFDLPICWEWSSLNDLGIIFNGNSVNSHKKMIYSKVKEGMPYIATKDVGYGSLDIGYDNGIKIPFGEEKFKVAHTNSILICSEGGSAGKKIGLINRDICFGNKLFANETFTGVLPKYVFYLYQSRFFRSSFNEKMTGIIGGISLSNFLSLVVPLPPLNEQRRIVTKVDQLMVLCDELESRQQKKEEARLRLNSAVLNKLLTAHEPAEFAHHWQRVCDNFDLLYDAPETVGELRKAILQLAVQGKLVRQDANDEPAAVLLERIKAEKERLVKERKIKKTKPLPPIKSNEIPYEIPNIWILVRLEETTINIEYGTSQKSSTSNIGVPTLRMNNINNGKIFYNNMKYIYRATKDLPRLFLKYNDILFNRTNSYELVGKTGVFKGENDTFTFASYLIRVSLLLGYVDSDFLNFVMNSTYFRKTQIEPEITQQCGQANFNGTKLKNTIIPLPPLAEQHRIVAKVDQLMAHCDELEAKLKQSQTDGEKLMATTVGALIGA